MKSKFLITFLFSIFSFSFAEYGWWMGSNVTELTTENFYSNVGTGDKNYIVEFYAKWCGYCRLMAPEYEMLYNKYHGEERKRSDIVIARIDGKENPEISDVYNVYAFPSVYIFKKGEITPSPKYQGIRKAEIFSLWIEDKIGPEPAEEEKKEENKSENQTDDNNSNSEQKENPEEPKIDEKSKEDPKTTEDKSNVKSKISEANEESQHKKKSKGKKKRNGKGKGNIELKEDSDEGEEEMGKPWLKKGERVGREEEFSEIPDTYQRLLDDIEKVKEAIQIHIGNSFVFKGLRAFLLSLFIGFVIGIFVFKRLFERYSQENSFFKTA